MNRYFHSICLVLLFFYAASSLSPRYVSVAGIVRSGDACAVTQEKSVLHGIVWLNLAFKKLLHGFRPDTAESAQQLGPQAAAEDLFLTKKKRAVFRERFNIAPPVQAEYLPADCREGIEPPVHSHDVAHDPIHHQTGGYYSLSTGLSPPALLS
jgi:hypothetical protein